MNQPTQSIPLAPVVLRRTARRGRFWVVECCPVCGETHSHPIPERQPPKSILGVSARACKPCDILEDSPKRYRLVEAPREMHVALEALQRVRAPWTIIDSEGRHLGWSNTLFEARKARRATQEQGKELQIINVRVEALRCIADALSRERVKWGDRIMVLQIRRRVEPARAAVGGAQALESGQGAGAAPEGIAGPSTRGAAHVSAPALFE